MHSRGKLHVANLGDSGIRLIRDGSVVHASAAQQHSFNMPFQLSHPTLTDSPDDADAAEVRAHARGWLRVWVWVWSNTRVCGKVGSGGRGNLASQCSTTRHTSQTRE
eukprot:315822-Chlamydomonas_euryale.AAC.1